MLCGAQGDFFQLTLDGRRWPNCAQNWGYTIEHTRTGMGPKGRRCDGKIEENIAQTALLTLDTIKVKRDMATRVATLHGAERICHLFLTGTGARVGELAANNENACQMGAGERGSVSNYGRTEQRSKSPSRLDTMKQLFNGF